MKSFTFQTSDYYILKEKLLRWANEAFDVFCCLDNNHYTHYKYSDYEFLIALGIEQEFTTRQDFFQHFDDFLNKKDWVFGHLNYDFKNQIENLSSSNPASNQFPEYYFFKPKILIELKENRLLVHQGSFNLEVLEKDILASPSRPVTIQARTDKETYLKDVQAIQNLIRKGTVYELNYCQEFYAEEVEINPISLFIDLNNMAKAPFSSFYKLKDQYLICSSPERFLKKVERKLISQPIKGTIQKHQNKIKNKILIEELAQSKKEQAENVMIVDLVRNDLARCSEPGTIKVEELFGIYEFETINQMISTISSRIENTPFTKIIKATFPMGSMTGAPKIEAMKQIDLFEKVSRGIYAGTIGYFSPMGTFDFNVVIRSLTYDHAKKQISLQVGGAITYDSDPEKEYSESLLKAKNLIEILS